MSAIGSTGRSTGQSSDQGAAAAYRFAVDVLPKPGILDPQGRAVEGSLGHLGIDGVSGVRVGRRVELTVTASSEEAARATVERLAGELLANPLIEVYGIELLGVVARAGAGAVATGPGAIGATAAVATPASDVVPARTDG